jgi:hypothetical protein
MISLIIQQAIPPVVEGRPVGRDGRGGSAPAMPFRMGSPCSFPGNASKGQSPKPFQTAVSFQTPEHPNTNQKLKAWAKPELFKPKPSPKMPIPREG